MKIILTGATGFVGGVTLDALLADPRVTAVTALTRRPLAVDSPKLHAIVHEDFTAYDDALLAGLAAHDACIWTLGGKASDEADPIRYERITHGFTLALARGIASRITRPFTFDYLSGMGADQAETSRLPWEQLTRRLKGRTERDLLALGERHDLLTVHCFRPGGILPVSTHPLVTFFTGPIAVGVRTLARAMIEAACASRYRRARPVIGNREIKRIAAGASNRGA